MRPVGRPRHRWVDNIKINLREIGWDGMDWIVLAQEYWKNTQINHPLAIGIILLIQTIIICLIRGLIHQRF
jgi:hypothetical protein